MIKNTYSARSITEELSKHLPQDAALKLNKAAKIEKPNSLGRAIAVDEAIQYVRIRYPEFFRLGSESSLNRRK